MGIVLAMFAALKLSYQKIFLSVNISWYMMKRGFA